MTKFRSEEQMEFTFTKYKNIAESLYVISVKGKPRIPKEMMIPIIGTVGLILQNFVLK